MADFSGHRPGDPEFRLVQLGLFMGGFAMFVQIFDVQAVLPAISQDFGVSAATAALTVSAASAGIALSVIPWALTSDRIGRVPVMKTAILGSGLIGLLSPFSPTLVLLIASRFIIGLSLGAIVAVSMAYLAEEIDSAHIAAAAAMFVSGNGVGALTGRVVAGLVGEWTTWRIGIGTLAVVAFGMAVAFIFVVPRSRRFVPAAPGGVRRLPRALGRLARDGGLLSFFAATFILTATVSVAYNYVGYRLLTPQFGVDTRLAVLVYLVFALGSASVFLVSRIVGRFGRVRILIVAFVVGAIGTQLLNIGRLPVLIIGLAMVTVGSFPGQALISGWVAPRAGKDRAIATAVYQLVGQTGSAVLGWSVGLLFGLWGWTSVTSYLLAGFLILLALSWTSFMGVERGERRMASARTSS